MKKTFAPIIAVLALAAVAPVFGQELEEADALRNAGRYADAAPVYEMYLLAHPDDGPAMYGLAMCCTMIGSAEQGLVSIEKGRAILDKLVKKYPNFPEYRYFNGYAWMVRGMKLEGDDRAASLENAQKEVLLAIEQEKDDSKKIYYQSKLAEVYKAAGKFAQARDLFASFNKTAPSPWYVFWIGECEQGLGNEAAAIDAWLTALGMDQNFTNPMNPLSTIAMRLQKEARYAEAAALLKRIVEKKPHPFHHGWALKYMADNLVDCGDSKGAIAALEEAEKVIPGEANFPNRLGLIMLAVGDRDGAIAAFKRAIQRNPDLLYPYENLSNTLAIRNRMKEARETLDAGITAARRVAASAGNRADLKAEAEFYQFLFRWLMDTLKD